MTRDEILGKLAEENGFYAEKLTDLLYLFNNRKKQLKSWIENLSPEERALLDSELYNSILDDINETLGRLIDLIDAFAMSNEEIDVALGYLSAERLI